MVEVIDYVMGKRKDFTIIKNISKKYKRMFYNIGFEFKDKEKRK